MNRLVLTLALAPGLWLMGCSSESFKLTDAADSGAASDEAFSSDGAAGGASSIIDVRTGAEYDGEHIKGSRLMPLDRLGERADQVKRSLEHYLASKGP